MQRHFKNIKNREETRVLLLGPKGISVVNTGATLFILALELNQKQSYLVEMTNLKLH